MIVKYLMNVYESYIKSLDVTPKEFSSEKQKHKQTEWDVGQFPGRLLSVLLSSYPVSWWVHP